MNVREVTDLMKIDTELELSCDGKILYRGSLVSSDLLPFNSCTVLGISAEGRNLIKLRIVHFGI